MLFTLSLSLSLYIYKYKTIHLYWHPFLLKPFSQNVSPSVLVLTDKGHSIATYPDSTTILCFWVSVIVTFLDKDLGQGAGLMILYESQNLFYIHVGWNCKANDLNAKSKCIHSNMAFPGYSKARCQSSSTTPPMELCDLWPRSRSRVID